MISVIATNAGFYGDVWRDAGVHFMIKDKQDFSKKWMKPGSEVAEKALAGQEGAGGKFHPSDEDVLAAVGLLVPADDTHWTKDGSPSLIALKEALGARISRDECDRITQSLTRQQAMKIAVGDVD